MMLRLHWQGESNTDIAMLTGYTPQQVSNIINSEEAQGILAALQAEALDTMSQVQTEAQFMAPKLFDNVVKLAEAAGDERVRLHANLAALGIAGHVPVKRVVVERENMLHKKFEDMTEDEIRRDIAGDLTPSDTKRPDGSILQ